MSTSDTNRLAQVDASQPLAPNSLVGSYFHGDQGRQWQGCVVAEPQPGVYLVELFSWVAGQSTEQRIVSLSAMGGWRFYDTAEWMNAAYENDGPGWRKREPEPTPTVDDQIREAVEGLEAESVAALRAAVRRTRERDE